MATKNHAALMDDIYRHQRFIYNLTRKYYLFGRDRLIRDLALAPDARLVEIGCGTGRNLIKMARRYPDAQLFGLDASHEMLKTASAAVHHAGLENRIHLAHGYAEQMTPATFGEATPFDHAVFSYSLSMIPDWRGAMVAAWGALKPTGTLHAVDFGDLMGLGHVSRALLTGWLHLFHVAPRTELIESFSRSPAAKIRHLPGHYAFILDISRKDAGAEFPVVMITTQPSR